MSDARQWTIRMTGVRPPLSMNDRSMHWGRRDKITRSIRDEAHWRAKAAKIPALPKVRVEIVWVVGDHRRRDEDNPAPSAKALYDGLVDASIVPDDTPEFMEKPSVRIEYRQGENFWFARIIEIIEPTEAA